MGVALAALPPCYGQLDCIDRKDVADEKSSSVHDGNPGRFL